MTVDRALIRAGSEAVAAGLADSLSGWVNLALSDRAAKERRLRALAEAVEAYEAEFGVISEAEMMAQALADARSAILVRGPVHARGRRSRRAAK